jgi:D-3-phosphoglycerate dehydrogenase
VQLLADGQRPARLVNPEVWPHARERIARAGPVPFLVR